MSNNISGNTFNNYGEHSIGVNIGADPQQAFRDMIAAVHALRGQVSPGDRQVIDESLRTIGTGANVERGPLRQALGSIAGIATMVGQVGAPVVEAVRNVISAFAL